MLTPWHTAAGASGYAHLIPQDVKPAPARISWEMLTSFRKDLCHPAKPLGTKCGSACGKPVLGSLRCRGLCSSRGLPRWAECLLLRRGAGKGGEPGQRSSGCHWNKFHCSLGLEASIKDVFAVGSSPCDCTHCISINRGRFAHHACSGAEPVHFLQAAQHCRSRYLIHRQYYFCNSCAAATHQT